METVGQRIKLIRNMRNLTQSEFASAINVKTAVSVSNYENGDREPDINTLLLIAKVGNVSLDWLLTGEGLPPQNDSLVRDIKREMSVNNEKRDELLDSVKQLGITEVELELIRKVRLVPDTQKLLMQLLDGRIIMKEAIYQLTNIVPEGNKQPLPNSNKTTTEQGLTEELA